MAEKKCCNQYKDSSHVVHLLWLVAQIGLPVNNHKWERWGLGVNILMFREAGGARQYQLKH